MKLVLCTVAAALVAAACASGDDGAAATGQGEGPAGVHGIAPAAVRGIPSVVSLTPADAGEARGPRTDPVTVDQLGMVFSPRFVIVPATSPVRFTNSESIAHNVTLTRVPDGTVVLDHETDPASSVDFGPLAAGGYDVTCSMHPGMTAFVYVTDAPYTVASDSEGAFVLNDVPPGEYTLNVWSLDEESRSSQAITVTASGAAVTLGG